jgi:hypothetical protein
MIETSRAHCRKFGTRGLAAVAAAGLALATNGAAAEDFRLQFPPIQTMSPKGVNLQTGRFEFSQDEFQIGPIKVDLRYTSEHHNYVFAFPTLATGFQNVEILHPANSVARGLRGFLVWKTLNTGGGGYMTVVEAQVGDSMLQFAVLGTVPNLTIMPWNLAAQGWKLERSGANFVLTNKSGDVYTFVDHSALPTQGYQTKNQVLGAVVYADGHRLDYSYGAQAEMRTIMSNRGYAVVLDYAAGPGTITVCGYNRATSYVDAASTCSAAPIKTTYSFAPVAGKLRLTAIADVDGNVSTIGYASGFVSCISFPASATCRIQNFYGDQPGDPGSLTAPDQVRRQVTPLNETWLYNYNNGPGLFDDHPPRQPWEVRYTHGRMTDPQGALTVVTFANGIVESIQSPSGTLTYEFNGVCPQKVTYPEGNAVRVVSSNACNVSSISELAKPGTGLASHSTTISYPAEYTYSNPAICNAASPKLCDKPIYKVDQRGNQTDYTHDPAHGGILTETGPAVNGVRPQIRHSYAQRYAWIQNSGGAFVQAASPVWVLTQKSVCKEGAASGAGCANPADEVRTTYDYGPDSGPNNLLLRGIVEDADGLALRTCYGYDWQGNKISETRPAANLTSCP